MNNAFPLNGQASLVDAFPFIVERMLCSAEQRISQAMRLVLWRSFALDGGPVATRASLAAALGLSHAGIEALKKQALENMRTQLEAGSPDLPESVTRQVRQVAGDLEQLGEIITGTTFRKLVQSRCGASINPRWFRLLAATLGYAPLHGAQAGKLSVRDLWIRESLLDGKAVDRLLQPLISMQGTMGEAPLGSLLQELRSRTGADITTRGLTTLIEVMPALEIHYGVVRTVTSYLPSPRDRNLRIRSDARKKSEHQCSSPMKDVLNGGTILVRHAPGETPEQAIARRKATHPRHRDRIGRLAVQEKPGFATFHVGVT
ncbi:MAG: hypothetical protein EA370_01030 [Wenzhouxiangella sp.]|nr:MAG: hypothetical protein EA370_01030 [Wenzhouxiangella sp.]